MTIVFIYQFLSLKQVEKKDCFWEHFLDIFFWGRSWYIIQTTINFWKKGGFMGGIYVDAMACKITVPPFFWTVLLTKWKWKLDKRPWNQIYLHLLLSLSLHNRKQKQALPKKTYLLGQAYEKNLSLKHLFIATNQNTIVLTSPMLMVASEKSYALVSAPQGFRNFRRIFFNFKKKCKVRDA